MRIFLIFLLILLLLNESANALTITDSSGSQIEIKRADRVVCLNGDCLEALTIIGVKDKIVGLSTNALQKPFAPNVTDVGAWNNPNIEAIINLKPDIVITYVRWPDKTVLEDKLKETGIKVVRLDFYRLDTIFDEFLILGKIMGKEQEVGELISFWKSQLDLIKSRTEKAEKVKVYWESYSSYSAAGNGTGWNEIIITAGGINVFGNENGYPKVDAEKIIAKNPEVIIKSVSSSVFQPYGAENVSKLVNFYHEIISRVEINQTDAGREGRVYVICTDMLHSTFGLIAESAYVAKILHPDIFPDLDPKELHRKYIESLGMEYKGVWVYPDLQHSEKTHTKTFKPIPSFEATLLISGLVIAYIINRMSGHDRP